MNGKRPTCTSLAHFSATVLKRTVLETNPLWCHKGVGGYLSPFSEIHARFMFYAWRSIPSRPRFNMWQIRQNNSTWNEPPFRSRLQTRGHICCFNKAKDIFWLSVIWRSFIWRLFFLMSQISFLTLSPIFFLNCHLTKINLDVFFPQGLQMLDLGSYWVLTSGTRMWLQRRDKPWTSCSALTSEVTPAMPYINPALLWQVTNHCVKIRMTAAMRDLLT